MIRDIRYIFNKPVEILGLGKAKSFTPLENNKYQNYLSSLHIRIEHYMQNETEDNDRTKRKYIRSIMKNFDVLFVNPMYFLKFIVLLQIIFEKIDEENFQKIDTIINDIENMRQGEKETNKLQEDLQTLILYRDDINEVVRTNYINKYVEFYSQLFLEDCKLTKEEIISKFSKETAIQFSDFFITRDNYDEIVKQIIVMNSLKFPKVAPDKKTQKRFDMAYESKSTESDLEDAITTICAYYKYSLDYVSTLSMYQISSLSKRMELFKAYDTGIQYLCAGCDPKDVKLKSYGDHAVDENEKDISVSGDKFSQSMGFLKK